MGERRAEEVAGSNDEHTVTVLDTFTWQTRAVHQAPSSRSASPSPATAATPSSPTPSAASSASSTSPPASSAPPSCSRSAAPTPHLAPGDSPVPIGVVLLDDPAVALVSEARSGRVAVIDLATATIIGDLAREPGIDGIAWAPSIQP